MPTAVPLPHLVDLALGTPEVGAVNFNVLHTLLHAMISKLGLGDVKADLNEHDREYLATLAALKPGAPVALRQLATTKKPSKPGGTSENDSDQTVLSGQTRLGSAGASDRDSAKGDDSILDDDSEIHPILSKASPYHQFENRLAELTKTVEELSSLPTTTNLLKEYEMQGVTKASEAHPIPNMWHSMQLKRRVDANEEGIDKLMTMMEDMMKELLAQKQTNKELWDSLQDLLKFDMNGLMDRLKNLEKLAETLRKDLDEGLADLQDLKDLKDLKYLDFTQFVRWQDLEDGLKGIRSELEKLRDIPDRVVIEMSSQTVEEPPARPPSAVSIPSRPASAKSGPSEELLNILETLGQISEGHRALERRVAALEEEIKKKADGVGVSEDLLNQLNKLKNDLEALQEAVSKLSKLSGGDTELRDQMDDLLTKIKEDHDAIGRLQQMLALLEAAIDKLNKTTQGLTEDGLDQDKRIDELYGLCKDLKKNKADKEYVDMEVDVKADKKQLEGKVNHHLFDDTTAEINRTIKDILEQLAGNSDEWKSMLAKLMNDLDGKLDRLELNPLKEWLEKKLKALSKKIQDGNLQWTEDEAAGLKRQLIQHYHCLSCDKPLDLMPTGVQPAQQVNYGMPPSRSPRPYTTYELDQIRQHAKSFGSPEQADFYATSRQCGGSHTTTLPHHRFSRLSAFNHLFRDEDPGEIVPPHKEEVDVMGADGHIYRGRMERLEAKMPTRVVRSAVGNRQSMTRESPRPASARGLSAASMQARQQTRTPRPMSARVPHRPEPAGDQQSAVTTPPPPEDVVLEEGGEAEITVEVPPVEMQVPVKGE